MEGMFTTHHIVRANWCCHEQQSSLNTWTRSLRDLSALPCERAGCGYTTRAAQTVNRQHNTTPEPVPATRVELMVYAHGRTEQSGLPPRAAHTARDCLTSLPLTNHGGMQSTGGVNVTFPTSPWYYPVFSPESSLQKTHWISLASGCRRIETTFPNCNGISIEKAACPQRQQKEDTLKATLE